VLRISPKIGERLAKVLLWGAGFLTILILATIVIYVLVNGVSEINWEFLTTPPLGGLSGEGGISTVIVTTIYLILITIFILTPVGIGAAIYLSEYAQDNILTNFIRYAVETLAGVPSIIYGLFGYALFVSALYLGHSLIAGALTLVCLLLPTMIRTTEEALRAVPQEYREASLALGATRWQTIWHVALPAALPGIATAIILSTGRVIEETACLYVTLGGSAAMPKSILSGGRTLALHVYYLAMDTMAFDKAMATAAVLIIIIVIINLFTNWLSQRFRSAYTAMEEGRP